MAKKDRLIFRLNDTDRALNKTRANLEYAQQVYFASLDVKTKGDAFLRWDIVGYLRRAVNYQQKRLAKLEFRHAALEAKLKLRNQLHKEPLP